MAETLNLIAELMGADVDYVVDTQRLRPAKSEVFRLCGDNSKISKLTDWKPQVSLREGLKRTIDWFTNPDNLAKYKSDIYNR
jgi:nucleoside-diphosphate-sugar epimerase